MQALAPIAADKRKWEQANNASHSREVPEDIALALVNHGASSPSQAAVQALAADGYWTGILSESQVMRLPALESRVAVHHSLRERRIPYQYTQRDLEEDLATLTDLSLR